VEKRHVTYSEHPTGLPYRWPCPPTSGLGQTSSIITKKQQSDPARLHTSTQPSSAAQPPSTLTAGV